MHQFWPKILFSEKTLDQKFIEMQLDIQYWTSLKALVQSVLRHYRSLFQRWLWFNELVKTIVGRITIIYIYIFVQDIANLSSYKCIQCLTDAKRPNKFV